MAAVERDGKYVLEYFDIVNSYHALENLLRGLYGVKEVPVGLELCKRCGTCGAPVVGYDSPDLIRR